MRKSAGTRENLIHCSKIFLYCGVDLNSDLIKACNYT